MFPQTKPTMAGAGWAMAAVCCFSVNDVLIKLMSGDYALHQVIFVRSFVGIAFLAAFLLPAAGGFAALKTRRLTLHLARGGCVVFANLCFFMALAALPLAEAVAIFFVSPLLISVFSVIFLGEYVGPRRWAAIAVGLIGVLIVLRPGTEAFQVAALLPLAAAAGYATLHILTRRLGGTDGAVSMAMYIQLTFLATSGLFGLAFADGAHAGSGHPSLEFLLRGWVWPGPIDALYMAIVGITSALGGYMISQAYRLSEAAFVAPFEYIAMPLAVLSGYLVFGELPDWIAIAGILLILGAGLVLIWREAVARRTLPDGAADALGRPRTGSR
ncbi:MAG: DMT family transporter [Pseudomonadota bacterium]